METALFYPLNNLPDAYLLKKKKPKQNQAI